MKSLRLKSVSGLSALLVAFFISFSGHAAGIGHIVVFGDSLSDNGNMLAQTGGLFPTTPAYFYGRQSNGLIWNETLAFDMGASLTTFAVAGAQTGTTNVWDGQLPGTPFGGLQNQIAHYVGGTMDPGAWHIIWAGANNFLSIPSDPVAAITQAVTDIITATGALLDAGMTNVSLINMPDLGLTPRLINVGLSAQGSFLTDQFNQALAFGLMQAGLQNIVPVFDVAGLMRAVVANPAAYGLTNVTDACIDPLDPFAPGSCLSDPTKDADGYMFWDDVHPTRATHLIFAEALRPVPVPAAVWLFGSALGLLSWVRYRAA